MKRPSHSILRTIGATVVMILAGAAIGCDGGFVDSNAPIIQVNPSTVHFEPVQAGHVRHLSVIVKNVGQQPLIVREISMASTDPEALSIVTDNLPELPHSLARLSEIQVNIKYAPTVSGAQPSGVITIKSNDPNRATSTVAVMVSATTTGLSIQPNMLTWGPTEITNISSCAYTAGSKSFTLRNTGNDVLTITSWNLEEYEGTSNPEDQFSACPGSTTILGESDVNWSVVFHPKSAGLHRARLAITSSAGTQHLILQGGSLDGGSLVVVPSSLYFSNVSVGQSQNKSFTITNIGSEPVTGSSMEFVPSQLADVFSITPTALGTLAAQNGAASLTVRFMPQDNQPIDGSLLIHHSLISESPIEVLLYGNNAVASFNFDPPVVEFTGLEPGESETYTVALSNSGTGNLVIDNVEIGEKAPFNGWEQFEVIPSSFSATLGAGDITSVQVKYTRPQSGISSGCLNISHNAPVGDNPLCLLVKSTAYSELAKPVANITGATSGNIGETIALSGASSQANESGATIQDYRWMMASKPTGSASMLNLNSSQDVSFKPDKAGSYTFVLTVKDSNGLRSNEAMIQVSAN